jgi:hypothetical protein
LVPGNFLKTALLVMLLVTVAPGCSDRKAAELYEAAGVEELHDKEKAVRLYERIIVVYPTSDYAVKAKTRIDELQKK